jgi:4-hydroxythreonine-4-phosphate dehydrogenase
MIPRIAITQGEPSGIGAEQMLMLAQSDWEIEWIVIGNLGLLQSVAQQQNKPFEWIEYQADQTPQPNRKGQIKICHLDLAEPAVLGQLNVANTAYVLAMLDRATDGCLSGEFDAMVTAAVHKGIINEAGLHFTGHTEYLADRSHTEQVVMMLATPGLRVPLATTHLPLREVPDAITPKLLKKVIEITCDSLENQIGIAQPTVYIAGLNPHAGEDGHLGME